MSDTNKIAKSFKALAANSAETNVKKNDLYRVPPHLLMEQEGFNARDYNDPEVEEHIERLAKAYEQGSVMPPVVARIDPTTGNAYLVDGHCRTRGALRAIARGAPIEHLDVLPFRGGDVDRVVLMLTAAQGLHLKPLGIADSYLRLHRMGKSNSDIAKLVGRTASHVESMLILATANSDVQMLVKMDKVSSTTAIEAVRKHGEKAGDFLTGKVKEAVAKGQSKVKASAIKEWVPPRSVVSKMYTNLGSLFQELADHQELNELMSKPEEEIAQITDRKIEVDAQTMVRLMTAYKAAEALKQKREGQTTDGQPAVDSTSTESA